MLGSLLGDFLCTYIIFETCTKDASPITVQVKLKKNSKMISINDLKNSVKLMDKEYTIANKLLKHIKEYADVYVDMPDVPLNEIEEVYHTLNELKLIHLVKPVYNDDSIPSTPEPRLTNEGKKALGLGMEKYIKRKNRTTRLVWVGFAVLIICASIPLISIVKRLFCAVF